ncbi:Borealin N terminal-domain-containing protein [Sphaerosporella brunnea]|uniref:Borealin N terminal-domain-containing protein n=1 Tax=Sphaerosporella brunnea TaxID=1250544 RepID=A0A5J5F0S7_9PEZI|nr:Borealin N terminal-domain-containing protein [Sphaerosporella brunnea]
MAPIARRKKRDSSSVATPSSPIADTIHVGTPRAPTGSVTKEPATSPKSPFRRVVDGRITKPQKQALLDNLEVEMNQRTRKLRSQVNQQVHALKQRIEMRINRIPKKFWKMTMADLLALAEGRDVSSAVAGVGGLKKFVGDVRKLSRGQSEKVKDMPLTVPKKRTAQKPEVSPARPKMPPPPAPLPISANPMKLTDKSNLPPSSSPNESRSPTRSQSPAKVQKASGRARKAANSAPISRPTSRTTTRSSIETAATQASTGTKGTKSSQARSKTGATNDAKGLKRGNAGNGTGSNGSLKENRVAGVKKETAGKLATGRVLRSRK